MMDEIFVTEEKLQFNRVHYWDNYSGDFIANTANRFTVQKSNRIHTIDLPIPKKRQVFNNIRLIRRLGRIDVGNAVFTNDKQAIIFVYFGSVYRYNLRTETLRLVCNAISSKNVLHNSIAVTDTAIAFGEYGMNWDFGPVHVWASFDDGHTFQIVHEFGKNSIFHTHGVFFDEFSGSFWIPTGDFENQCHLYKFSNDFTSFEKIGDGSQKFRAVSLMFSKTHVHWGMDSPLEKSFMMSLNRLTGEIKQQQAFDAPVWFSKTLDDSVILLQTTVEPGPSVTTDSPKVFASRDYETWVPIFGAKKDIWPKNYFKFGSFGFSGGAQTTDNFILFCEAVKGYDGVSLRARIDMARLDEMLNDAA